MPLLRTLLATTLLVLTLLWAPAGTAASKDKTLPPQYAKAGHPTVLAFYAPWCSGCKQIKPLETMLEDKTHTTVTWHHVDVDTRDGKVLGYRYDIHSTPSYLLFKADGQPDFSLSGRVSPGMLQHQVYKLAGLRKAIPFPTGMATPEIKRKNPIAHLVRFTANQCNTSYCKKDSKKFAYFQQQLGLWPYKTNIWQMDTAKQATYFKQITATEKPYDAKAGVYYALMDTDGVPLFRHNRPLNPEAMRTIASILQMVAAGQVK